MGIVSCFFIMGEVTLAAIGRYLSVMAVTGRLGVTDKAIDWVVRGRPVGLGIDQRHNPGG